MPYDLLLNAFEDAVLAIEPRVSGPPEDKVAPVPHRVGELRLTGENGIAVDKFNLFCKLDGKVLEFSQ